MSEINTSKYSLSHWKLKTWFFQLSCYLYKHFIWRFQKKKYTFFNKFWSIFWFLIFELMFLTVKLLIIHMKIEEYRIDPILLNFIFVFSYSLNILRLWIQINRNSDKGFLTHRIPPTLYISAKSLEPFQIDKKKLF